MVYDTVDKRRQGTTGAWCVSLNGKIATDAVDTAEKTETKIANQAGEFIFEAA